MLRGTVLRVPHGLTGDIVEYCIPPMLAGATPDVFAALDTQPWRRLAEAIADKAGSAAGLASLVQTLSARSGWLASVEPQFADIWRGSSMFRAALARPSPRVWSIDALQSVHGALMGQGSSPLRATPVWLGREGIHRSAFVPPPPTEVPPLMHDLCALLNRRDVSPIALATMAFMQLGVIHPFADGNGRLARWLWLALLRSTGVGASALGLVLLAAGNNPTRLHLAASRFVSGDLATYAEWLAELGARLAALVPEMHANLLRAHAALMEALVRVGARPDLAARCAHGLMQRPVFMSSEFQTATASMASQARAKAMPELEQAGLVVVDTASAPNAPAYVAEPVRQAWVAIADRIRLLPVLQLA